VILRVLASVGHGQQTRLGVAQLEVLIGELVAVDGLAAGSLGQSAFRSVSGDIRDAHVAAGEVTALEHELRDDAVELGALVAEARGAGAQFPEVTGSPRVIVVVEVESDPTRLDYSTS
jgi:hypothetical protein